MANFNTDIFACFHTDWALLTAGDAQSYNTMTISWGGLGTLWGKSVATVYVKPIRYTYDFMEKSDYFTISFYPESHHADLVTLGSKSGRDGDKIALTNLTPKPLTNAMTFAQAKTTILCRKIYWQDLALENMPAEAVAAHYQNEAPHRMYIGEVLEVIEG